LPGRRTERVTLPIKRFELFGLPNCKECSEIYEYLQGKLNGDKTDLIGDGAVKFRKVYSKLKSRIKRDEHGSIPIPTVLFYDEADEIIHIAYKLEEVKKIIVK